jgi:hypothetical protein
MRNEPNEPRPWRLEIKMGQVFTIYEYGSMNNAEQAARAFRQYPQTYAVRIYNIYETK